MINGNGSDCVPKDHPRIAQHDSVAKINCEDTVMVPSPRCHGDVPTPTSTNVPTTDASGVPVPVPVSSSAPAPLNPSVLSHNQIRHLLLSEANYDCDHPSKTPKRSSYITWDDYFMAIAFLSARRSKDPQSPTGACLVDHDNRVVGIGYNGFPRGCSDDVLPWERNENTVREENINNNNNNNNKLTSQSPSSTTTTSSVKSNLNISTERDTEITSGTTQRPFLHTPTPYECHAEINAILNKCSADVAGTKMYVPHFPCNECAKMIAQSRIRKVIYMEDRHHDHDVYRASRIILQMAGVETVRLLPKMDEVILDLLPPNGEESQPQQQQQQQQQQQHEQQEQQEQRDDGHQYIGNLHSNFAATVPTEPTDCAEQSNQGEIPSRVAECLRIFQRETESKTLLPSSKRQDYLSWDDYFMAMAFLTAQRSKDPNTQVGACIVSRQERIILALGYNGFPRGCSDDCLPWARQSSTSASASASASALLHTKYPYVCHAEVNAILNKGSANLRDAILYVALFPCNECAKMIIQAGIVEVVYLHDYYHDTDMCRASRILFGMAGVTLRQLVPSVRRIRLDFQTTCSCG